MNASVQIPAVALINNTSEKHNKVRRTITFILMLTQ